MASCSDTSFQFAECPGNPPPRLRMANILERYQHSLTPAQVAFLTLLQQAEDNARIIVTQDNIPAGSFIGGVVLEDQQIKLTFDFYLPDISGKFEFLID